MLNMIADDDELKDERVKRSAKLKYKKKTVHESDFYDEAVKPVFFRVAFWTAQ